MWCWLKSRSKEFDYGGRNEYYYLIERFFGGSPPPQNQDSLSRFHTFLLHKELNGATFSTSWFFERYFSFYTLDLLVLPRQLTITLCILSIKAGIKPVHWSVYQVLCACGTESCVNETHIRTTYTLIDLKKSFSIV